MKSRKQIIAEVIKGSVPKFDISLLTDQQLDNLEQIMKKNGLQYISIEEAVKNGFKMPEKQNEIINQLIKFLNNGKKQIKRKRGFP